MSKSRKCRANYFKHSYQEDRAPAELRPMLDNLRSGKGNRFGHRRKTFAKEKVFDRRIARSKAKMTKDDVLE